MIREYLMHPMTIVLAMAVLSALVEKILRAWHRKGEGTHPMCIHGETICVIIAAGYGVPCEGVVSEAMASASTPQSLRVHVLKALNPTESKPKFAQNERLTTNLVLTRSGRVDPAAASAWLIRQYYAGETYLCILPPDALFAPAWDASLKSMLSQCNASEPVLSTMPPKHGAYGATFLRAKRQKNGEVCLEVSPYAEPPAHPQPSPFVCAQFVFASGRIAALFPPASALDIRGADLVVSRTLWTQGCQFFTPHVALVWSSAAHRAKSAIRLSRSVQRHVPADAVRTEEEYGVYCGIREGVLSRRARLGLTLHPRPLECIAKYGTDAPLDAFNEYIALQKKG